MQCCPADCIGKVSDRVYCAVKSARFYCLVRHPVTLSSSYGTRSIVNFINVCVKEVFWCIDEWLLKWLPWFLGVLVFGKWLFNGVAGFLDR